MAWWDEISPAPSVRRETLNTQLPSITDCSKGQGRTSTVNITEKKNPIQRSPERKAKKIYEKIKITKKSKNKWLTSRRGHSPH